MNTSDYPAADDVRLAELEAAVAQLRGDLLDLNAALGATTAAAESSVEPIYDSLEAWVEEYFCVVFARSVGGELRWCRKWHDHAEAVTRLEALWRSWEALRLDPNLGIATWLTNFLDPQLGQLLHRSGTFGQCNETRHCPQQALLGHVSQREREERIGAD